MPAFFALSSQSARDGPDTHIRRPGFAQDPGARARGRPCGKDIVDENNAFTIQPHALANDESALNILRPLLPRKFRLGEGGEDAFEESCADGQFRSRAQTACEPFSLIEFTFALARCVQWHWHETIPTPACQFWVCLPYEQFSQERFEPKRPLILITPDAFENGTAGRDSGTRKAKMQFQVATICAFEVRCDVAGIWEAAAITKRWSDEAHPGAASIAYEPRGSTCAFLFANLAKFGKNQRHRRIADPSKQFAFHPVRRLGSGMGGCE